MNGNALFQFAEKTWLETHHMQLVDNDARGKKTIAARPAAGFERLANRRELGRGSCHGSILGRGNHTRRQSIVVLGFHGDANRVRFCKIFGLLVSGIGMTNDAHAGISREHALDPLRHSIGTISHGDLPGMK